MGWYFSQSNTNRRHLITELTKPRTQVANHRSICLTSCTRGNILWSVWEHQILVEQQGGVSGPDQSAWVGKDRFICCDLMQNGHYDGWGYKPMDESCHPFYYTCPLGYLDMVPEVACHEWRDNVKKYHEQRKAA